MASLGRKGLRPDPRGYLAQGLRGRHGSASQSHFTDAERRCAGDRLLDHHIDPVVGGIPALGGQRTPRSVRKHAVHTGHAVRERMQRRGR